MISADHLREILHYDPLTGLWVRLIARGRHGCHKAGEIVGHVNQYGKSKGYLSIHLDGKLYLGHRLAWLYMTDAWPKHQIDHINGVRGDDRWENLREATHAENARNSRKKKGGLLKGVVRINSIYTLKKPFSARITVDRKGIHLGMFASEEAAHAAYCTAAIKYHKKFARTT